MLCDLSQQASIDQRDGKGMLRFVAGMVGRVYVKGCLRDYTFTHEQPDLACGLTS